MIEINFRQIVDKHRFSIQMIHNNTQISRGTLTNLYYNRVQRIDLHTLNELCNFFSQELDSEFNPSDLLKYKRDI